MSFPNPKVNRAKRPAILAKRIRGLEKKKLKPGDKRLKRLAQYKTELGQN